jgi:hypothetical protein
MTAQPRTEDLAIEAVRAEAEALSFHPRGTVRCAGTPLFRSQLARDLGCLLDVDPDVEHWSCLPLVLSSGGRSHVSDFLVSGGQGTCLLDAAEAAPEPWVKDAARREGFRFRWKFADEIRAGARLANARDLLRYARWSSPLGDRVRLLAALDENGSMTVAECMTAFRETPPIAGLSSLILHRFVEVDLDEARIGLETLVRRCRP